MIVAFSFAILVLLIIGAVLLGMSLARAASKEDHMDQRWLEAQWLKAEREVRQALYDQDDAS